MPKALDMVRDTARFGWSASSSSADGVPTRRNSPYASSTTTTQPPGTSSAAARTRSTVVSGNAVPVGLFGLASRTTDGRCSASTSTAWAGSSVKSSARRPTTQAVDVSRAYSGYIEYVGAKDTAVRPGPPNAWSRWSITSFEPFAAQTCDASTATPDSRTR